VSWSFLFFDLFIFFGLWYQLQSSYLFYYRHVSDYEKIIAAAADLRVVAFGSSISLLNLVQKLYGRLIYLFLIALVVNLISSSNVTLAFMKAWPFLPPSKPKQLKMKKMNLLSTTTDVMDEKDGEDGEPGIIIPDPVTGLINV
jgi:hypothetical protein